ncbi:MFS transporter [Fangia hongkongensis]|nr:MFS transporter [Fangia hongkongensis]
MKKHSIKVILLSSIGGMLEFYDFVIFAIYAAIIGTLFFPSTSESYAILYGFLSFGVGYLARPIGGIFFGHLGDKYGRKLTFSITIFIMGVSTLIIGLLPSYESIGLSATILFILFRILQGMAIGGELSGAITFAAEHIPDKKRLAIGILYAFVNIGILLASLVYALTFDLSYGWRLAAIAGGMTAILSYFIRKSLLETPEFLACSKVRYPIISLFKWHSSHLISALCLISYLAVIVSLGFLFIPSYLKLIHYPADKIGIISSLGMLYFTISTLLFAFFADKIKQPKLYLSLFILATTILSFAIFSGFQSKSFNTTYYYIFALLCGPITVFIPSMITELFTTQVKYSGIGISYNLAFAIFGGLSPVIATILLTTSSAKSLLHSPASIILLCAFLSFFALKSIREK